MTVKELYIICLEAIVEGNKDAEVIIYDSLGNKYIHPKEGIIKEHYYKGNTIMLELE